MKTWEIVLAIFAIVAMVFIFLIQFTDIIPRYASADSKKPQVKLPSVDPLPNIVITTFDQSTGILKVDFDESSLSSAQLEHSSILKTAAADYVVKYNNLLNFDFGALSTYTDNVKKNNKWTTIVKPNYDNGNSMYNKYMSNKKLYDDALSVVQDTIKNDEALVNNSVFLSDTVKNVDGYVKKIDSRVQLDKLKLEAYYGTYNMYMNILSATNDIKATKKNANIVANANKLLADMMDIYTKTSSDNINIPASLSDSDAEKKANDKIKVFHDNAIAVYRKRLTIKSMLA